MWVCGQPFEREIKGTKYYHKEVNHRRGRRLMDAEIYHDKIYLFVNDEYQYEITCTFSFN